jgi:organic hydroperoxide reductase OsmC/OhrA
MVQSVVELRNVPGTEAALGWAAGHTVVVDRPEGKAGGMGLGFNGAQLLGLAIGGCYCNDLRYAAHDLGVEIGEISVTVRIELDGSPLVATSAVLTVRCDTSDGSDPKTVIDRAWSVCTLANSLNQGVKTTLELAQSEAIVHHQR